MFVIYTFMLLKFAWVTSGLNLKAYDCGSKNISKMEVYDLSSIEDCNHSQLWYPKNKTVKVQILSYPLFQKMNVTSCAVKKTVEISHCAAVTDIRHGVVSTPIYEHNDQLSAEDCLHLIMKNELRYKGQKYKTGGSLDFTADFVTMGITDKESASCSVIFKSLNRDETLILDEKIYNIRSKGAKTEEKTYIWNDPMKMCSEGGNLKDIIITKAVVYEPQNINLPRMLLYRSDDKQMTFGFNIEAKIEKCGSYLHKTQSASIFLNILEENDDSSHWPITNLQPATSDNLSEKDILKANIGYNHVTFNKKLSDSIQIISNKTCQNERSIRESQISLFPLETDAGMRLLFGLGYHGIVRGQVVYVMKCPIVDVYLHDRNINLTQDLPVWREVEGKKEYGFIDGRTHKFKKDTIYLIDSRLFTTMFKVGSVWKCFNNGKLDNCEPPYTVSYHYKALDYLLQFKNHLTMKGGLYKSEFMRNFDLIIKSSRDRRDTFLMVGQAIISNENDTSIIDMLQLNTITDTIKTIDDWTVSLTNWTYWILIAIIILIAYCIIIRIMRFCKSSEDFRTTKHLLQSIIFPTQFNEAIQKNRYLSTLDKVNAIRNQALIENNVMNSIPVSHSRQAQSFHTNNEFNAGAFNINIPYYHNARDANNIYYNY